MFDYDKCLNSLIMNGDLAIVSAGFRCHTKAELFKRLKIAQESLPFDSGFFPPDAVAFMLGSSKIDLAHSSPNLGHTACIKIEDFMHEEFGKGIRFEPTSYEEINRLACTPDQRDINKYLDSTFGYYTLDIKNRFVLAHYNWHRFSSVEHSGGIFDVETNINSTSALLTKRLMRLHHKCHKAKSVIFVVGETQGYEYMLIDNIRLDLRNLGVILDAANRVFGNKCYVVNLSDIESPKDVFDILS